MKSRVLTACIVVLTLIAPWVAAASYEANWESLDKRPTPQWWVDAKFGIFIHWGVYSVPAWSVRGKYSEWYWRRVEGDKKKNGPWWQFHKENYGETFAYQDFAPLFKTELYDANEWARTFKDAGAKYIVLTSKHHDGFCLWPSKHANDSWGRPWNSVDAGPGRDLLGELTDAVRKTGVEMGIYYSLYEWFNPLWKADRALYVDKLMFPQFKDVVTRYRPAVIFSDGEWDMPSKDWRSEELLAWLFNDSPVRDHVVINDRWGKDCRHRHGGYYTTEYGAGLKDDAHPWEECRGMAHSFGYSRTEKLEDYRTARELVLMLVDIVSRGGNLLLDIGPTGDGRIPVIMTERLIQMGDWLKVNGEAIYGSKPWDKTMQWTQGKRPEVGYGGQHMAKYDIAEITSAPAPGKATVDAFFTTQGDTLYAIMPRWPSDRLVVRDIAISNKTQVSLLGVNGHLDYEVEGRNLIVNVPCLSVEEVPCQHAYTLKITNVKSSQKGGFKTIFNGKDLSGWDGDERLWSVRNGALRGETTPQNKANGNTFLIWEGGQTKDFELRLSFRCNATNNSGIQYRSKRTAGRGGNKWVVRGYQHEIRNQNILPSVSGFIYDEGGLLGGRGRTCLVGEKAVWGKDGKKVIETLITAEGYKKLFKLNEWNDVVIRCKGNHIQHYTNGKLVLDFVDGHPKARSEGVLALQLHGGKPMWVEFKDIRIKEL